MTNAQMIQHQNTTNGKQLHVAFEQASKEWKLLFSDGQRRSESTIEAGDRQQFEAVLEKVKQRFGLEPRTPIISCYEAGRDGFWWHRYLESQRIENLVVDSSSIEVNRRKRRTKTDRVDVGKLMNMLQRHSHGERDMWSVVHVPGEEDEDLRRMDRERKRLQKEKTQHTNRMRSLLVLYGIRLGISKRFLEQVEEVRQWNGKGLPEEIKKELRREYQRYELVREQMEEVKEERQAKIREGGVVGKKVLALQQLKGIGPVSAWTLVLEFFGWRQFGNVKEVGAAAGLAPSPYRSGMMERDPGITKAGNRRIRSLMIELGWFWLRFQPHSALSRWFMERFAAGKRLRRVGIVALARKLLVALWKYLEQGIIPEGAALKG